MNVVVPIPDDLVMRFGSKAALGRRMVEALALGEYRAGRLTRLELRQLLGFSTHGDLVGFLKAHDLDGGTAARESDREIGDLNSHAGQSDLVTRFQAFAAGRTLGGLDVNGLISEGRR